MPKTAVDKLRDRIWYIKNRDRLLEKQRVYSQQHVEAVNAAKNRWLARNPEKRKASQRKWYEKNKIVFRQKKYARNALQRTIKNGKIIRPSVCAACGCRCKPHAHHKNGYDPQHYLDVDFLCSKCHKLKHAN